LEPLSPPLPLACYYCPHGFATNTLERVNLEGCRYDEPR
jgi:hypothetical protein